MRGLLIQKNRKSEGQILIETLFSIILLILIIFSTFEIGSRFIFGYKLETAARNGVELASLLSAYNDEAVHDRVKMSLISMGISPKNIEKLIVEEDPTNEKIITLTLTVKKEKQIVSAIGMFEFLGLNTVTRRVSAHKLY